jgi:hypothetical protein
VKYSGLDAAEIYRLHGLENENDLPSRSWRDDVWHWMQLPLYNANVSWFLGGETVRDHESMTSFQSGIQGCRWLEHSTLLCPRTMKEHRQRLMKRAINHFAV